MSSKSQATGIRIEASKEGGHKGQEVVAGLVGWLEGLCTAHWLLAWREIRLELPLSTTGVSILQYKYILVLF